MSNPPLRRATQFSKLNSDSECSRPAKDLETTPLRTSTTTASTTCAATRPTSAPASPTSSNLANWPSHRPNRTQTGVPRSTVPWLVRWTPMPPRVLLPARRLAPSPTQSIAIKDVLTAANVIQDTSWITLWPDQSSASDWTSAVALTKTETPIDLESRGWLRTARSTTSARTELCTVSTARARITVAAPWTLLTWAASVTLDSVETDTTARTSTNALRRPESADMDSASTLPDRTTACVTPSGRDPTVTRTSHVATALTYTCTGDRESAESTPSTHRSLCRSVLHSPTSTSTATWLPTEEDTLSCLRTMPIWTATRPTKTTSLRSELHLLRTSGSDSSLSISSPSISHILFAWTCSDAPATEDHKGPLTAPTRRSVSWTPTPSTLLWSERLALDLKPMIITTKTDGPDGISPRTDRSSPLGTLKLRPPLHQSSERKSRGTPSTTLARRATSTLDGGTSRISFAEPPIWTEWVPAYYETVILFLWLQVRYKCPDIPVESERYLRWAEGTLGQASMYLRPVGFPKYDTN